MKTHLVSLFIFVTVLLVVNPLNTVSQAQGINGGAMPFTYAGARGPDKWGSLNPKFSACSVGKSQSPIDIAADKAVPNTNLKPLARDYHPANATLVDSGFNVGIRFPENSGGLTIDGKKYMLKQMHWHAPSEHRIDGVQYDAELHLVHVAEDGNVSVVATLYKYGHPDALIAKIQSKLAELAKEASRSNQDQDEVQLALGKFNAKELRKRSHKYYRYHGSFSTPPCTETVIWTVLAKVRSISKEQVEALRAPLNMRCKHNSRPCQKLNGRQVQVFHSTTASSLKSPTTKY